MKLGLYITVLFICFICFAQKPSFEQIEYVSYEEANGQINTDTHFIIDGKGTVTMELKLYKGPEYSTFTLMPEDVKLLNELFNSKATLSSYKTTDVLRPGMHYGGNYTYISFTNTNSKTQQLVYIEPFMSKRFDELMSKIIQRVVWNEKKTLLKKSALDTVTVKARIQKLHKKAALPAQELPPPARE